MELVFTVRMSKETAEKLAALSRKTMRTRAGVVRWLIAQAAEEHGIKSENTDTVPTSTLVERRAEGQK